MFYLHLHDAEPNSNYGEFVAAAYESEAALWEGEYADAYAQAAVNAEQSAWDKMINRNSGLIRSDEG